MCLAVPGQVVATYQEHGLRMGTIDFGGVRRGACLEHVPDAQTGDYVLVHVGYVLSRIDAEEAQRIFALLQQLDPQDEPGLAP